MSRSSSPHGRASRWAAMLTTLTLLFTAVLAVTWQSAEPAFAATTTAVVGTGSGRCLDVAGGAATSGSGVQLYDCNGQPGQQWDVTSAGELRVFDDSMCLDAYQKKTAPGTTIDIYACNGGSNQQWRVNSDGTITGVQSGLCLDATSHGTANGTAIELWTCNGGTNQKWTTTGGSGSAHDGQVSDTNIKFVGRWDTTSSASAYTPYWAGAYYRVGFTGRTVKLRQRGTIDLWARIDGGAVQFYNDVSGTVNLTSAPLAAGNHTLQVNYQVVAGSYHGDAVFQGLVLDSGATTYAPPAADKLIEFVGDSITVGTTTSQNARSAYGWLTGERLGTEHTQIAQGGACLVATADGCVGLEQQFTKLNPNAATPAWDFSRYQANAVVINLGTNDVGHGVSTAQFQTAYVSLLHKVRAAYPGAWIFAMRNFKGRYAAQTQSAVTTLNSAGDSRVSFIDTTGWLTTSDFTDGTHPTDHGHVVITDHLAPIVAARL